MTNRETVSLHHHCTDGLTLRDYFAGQALVGFLSDPSLRGDAAKFARCSYDLADAMLEARKVKAT